MKQRPQKIRIDLLDRDIWIHLVEDSSGIEELSSKLQLDYVPDGPCSALFIEDDDGEYHIIYSRENLNHKVIVHESFHATHHILHELGQNWDIDNHEIYALLIEYLFDKTEQLFYGSSPKFQMI